MKVPQSGLYSDSPSFPLLQASISYWGISSAAGLATTVVCADLVAEPDYAGLLIKILDGVAAGQVRQIASDIAGTITVAAAFAVAIDAGIRFVILSSVGGGGGVPPGPPGPSVSLWMFGHCSPAMGASPNTIVCPNLAGLGDNIFNNEFWMQSIKATVAATERQIRRITDYTSATGTFIVDPFANNVSPGDDVTIFHESIMSHEILGFGTITTSSATVPRDATRAEVADYFNGCLLMPTEGDCRFQPRRIVDYAANGTFTIDPNNPFTVATGAVDYVIIGDQTEFVPGVDGENNRTPSDVIGSKTDTAILVSDDVSSVIRYLKGILNTVVATNSGFQEQPDVAVNTTAPAAPAENNVLNLAVAGTRYIVRSLRLKCGDPGANTVTVRLYELVNNALTQVDTFAIDATNFGTNHSLMDMFGLPYLAGDQLQVTVQVSAGAAIVVTGQYSHATAT